MREPLSELTVKHKLHATLCDMGNEIAHNRAVLTSSPVTTEKMQSESVAKSRRESRDELRQVIKDLYDHIGFVPPKPKKRQRACLRIRRARQKERELAAQQAAHKLTLSRAANVVREWVRRRQDNERTQQLTLCVSAFAAGL